MAASASASAATGSHRFEPAEGQSFHEFLKGFASPAEKEVAMVAKRWGAAMETEGLPGTKFELLDDGHDGIRFRILWAVSAPDHRESFLRVCPVGVWLTIQVAADSPSTAPKFEAAMDAVGVPIPRPALCKAVAKVCNDRAYKVCADAMMGAPSASGPWPVRTALATLDKGMGTILAVLGSRMGGAAAAASPRVAPSAAAAPEGGAAAASGPPAAPGAVEELLAQGAMLDAVEAAVAEAGEAGDAAQLRGMAAKCGEIMARLDGIACGGRGSPARQLRKEIIVRAERIADTAERLASL